MTGKPTTHVDGQVAEHVLEQAAGWVARLQSNDATDVDRRDFQEWLARDPAHQSAYDDMRQLWGDLKDVPIPSRPRPTRRIVVGQLLGLTVAAGLVVLAGRAGLIDRLRADHYTAIGEVRSLVLDDGTRVDLNTDSAIAIRYSAAERRVELLRGDAFFDVAKNPDRPFVVTESGWRATALGTRYGVRTPSGAHDGEVSVEEGHVEVSGEGEREGIVLRAGDSTSLTRGLPLAARPVDVVTETAWRSGKLVFSGRPLREVLATLGRYRRGTILVLDERAASQTVSGIFDLRDTDQALDALEDSLPVSVHRLSDMVVVVRSR